MCIRLCFVFLCLVVLDVDWDFVDLFVGLYVLFGDLFEVDEEFF